MIGFRFRFKVPRDEPGDPKIFLPRIIFLVPGLLLLGFGLWEAWRCFHLSAEAESRGSRFALNLMEMNLEPRSIAGIHGFVFLLAGALFLWLALAELHSLRKGTLSYLRGPMVV